MKNLPAASEIYARPQRALQKFTGACGERFKNPRGPAASASKIYRRPQKFTGACSKRFKNLPGPEASAPEICGRPQQAPQKYPEGFDNLRPPAASVSKTYRRRQRAHQKFTGACSGRLENSPAPAASASMIYQTRSDRIARQRRPQRALPK